MNKLLLSVFSAVFMVSGLFAQGMYSGDVLFVGDMWGADSAIVAQLEYLGFNVTQGLDTDVDSSWADGKKFVYVSSTSSSGDVADKFKNVTIPVLMIEGWATDDMGMADETNIANGTQDRDLVITEEGHYLAAGLTDTVKIVYDSTITAHHVMPSGDALTIAEFIAKDGDVDYNYGAIFAYEAGDELADGTTAAGRRYFACWENDGYLHLSGSGFNLWLAMINWACGKDEAPDYSGDVLYVSDRWDVDTTIINQLEYMGFNVTNVLDSESDSTMADGKKFVYVSTSTQSGEVAAKFKNVEVPVLAIEAWITDDMGMTDPTQEYNGTQERDIMITEEDHFLAAGLTGTIKIVDDSTLTCHHATPGGDALTIAEYVYKEGDVNYNYGAMFAYEKDDELVDGSLAAERRYWACWGDHGFVHFTRDGMKLWLASIDWACGFDVDTAVETAPVTTPSIFTLSQNYPNPFNPSTMISFSIPSKARVQLDIYNINGQKVAALKNKKMDAGRHEVRFEANGLTSGVYLYKLRVDSKTLVKKMTLIH